MFDHLKNALKVEYREQARKRAEFVANGSQDDSDRGIWCWSTANKWNAYQAGQIGREKAVELAVKRGRRDIEKALERQMEKLARAEAAPRLSYASITVEWHKSPTWGANPSVTAYTDDGTYTGRASGCGYDKESAAIGEALNRSAAVLRVLYEAAEAALAAGKKPNSEGLAPGCVTWRDILGYGSGYAILPYFEGGVGASCFWDIFKTCGYKCRHTATGKRFDTYSVEPMRREG